MPPQYPEVALSNMAEGIVLVSFRVLASGETDDVTVVYSVGHPVFQRAAVRAVESWEYNPATKGGTPIDSQRLRVALPFRLSEEPTTGAREKFRTDLIAARDALAVRDLDDARVHVQELEAMEWLTLYEIAHRALVSGILAHLDGRYDDAARFVAMATFYDGLYIGGPGYRDALIWSLRTAFVRERYGLAMESFRNLEALGGDPIPSDLVRLEAKLEAIRDNDEALTRTQTIAPRTENDLDPVTSYTPLRRRVVAATDESGALQQVDVRCDAHEYSFEPDDAETISLEEAWGNCTLTFHGRAGATVTITEPPAV